MGLQQGAQGAAEDAVVPEAVDERAALGVVAARDEVPYVGGGGGAREGARGGFLADVFGERVCAEGEAWGGRGKEGARVRMGGEQGGEEQGRVRVGTGARARTESVDLRAGEGVRDPQHSMPNIIRRARLHPANPTTQPTQPPHPPQHRQQRSAPKKLKAARARADEDARGTASDW